MIEPAREAFNRAADAIEATAVRNPINAWMREVSRRHLLATFPRGSRLVEIGCGAGADAAFLAERDYRIVGIDISDRMVELARQRIANQGLDSAVKVLRGRLVDVLGELSRSEWFPFDGAYANFSLTYEKSLRELLEALSLLLRPGARFLFTLPNKLCLAEPAIALARFRVRGAFGRFRKPASATIRGTPVPITFYAPSRVREILNGLFEIEGTAGVPVFMPPPSMYRRSFERLRAGLELIDDRLAGRFPWKLLGETTLFRVRKADS